MNNDKRKEVELLIDKAAGAAKSEDALRFSQAACNAANAMVAIKAAGEEAGNYNEASRNWSSPE